MNGIKGNELHFSPHRHNGHGDFSGTKRNENTGHRNISQWTRDDLEDKYLVLHDDHIKLKSHCRNQEEKIKILTAKARKNNYAIKSGAKDGDSYEDVEILTQNNAKLNKTINLLKGKMQEMKTELLVLRNRKPMPTGIQAKPNISLQTAPVVNNFPTKPFARSRSMTNVANRQRQNNFQMEEQIVMKKHHEAMIANLSEEVESKNQELIFMREQLNNKELLSATRERKDRTKREIEGNFDTIRMRQDLGEKQAQISALQSRYENLQAKMSSLEAANNQLMGELESTRSELRGKDDSRYRLESEVKHMSTLKKQVNELEHSAEEILRENKILKEENNKLSSNAFDADRERKWRATESAMRAQIAQLESTLRKDVGEKGNAINSLYGEKEKTEAAEKEATKCRTQYYELKLKFDELSDKFRYFTKDDHLDMREIEEALMVVRQKKTLESPKPKLDFLQEVDYETGGDVNRKLHEIEIQHAETIQELEKTRNMLVVQYQINKDYKMESDTATNRLEELKNDYEEKLSEFAKLLDIRAARIHKLEKQIKDIAYGTRQFTIGTDKSEHEEVDMNEGNDELEETVALQRGENMLEIHIGRLIMNENSMRHFANDREPTLFATWDFFEFETQATAVKRGPRPDFDLTALYSVKVDDFFLHYLQKDSTVFELYEAVGSEHRILGACRLLCRQVLERQQARNRVHLTAQVIGVGPGIEGEDLGLLEYWVRLRVPMDQALRLYRERSKALGYVVSNEKTAKEALKALDDNANKRPSDNINELHIKVVRCRGVQARRNDMQPSIYFVYKFFDFPDHDSAIVASSNNPEFDDHKMFAVHTSSDLDRFLKTQPLLICVFDDTDPDNSSYLGMAVVPMIPLAHNKPVAGIFELRSKNGSPNGSIEVELRWRFSYLPVTFSGDAANLPASNGTDTPVHLLPGEKEKMLSAESSRTQITKPVVKERLKKQTAGKQRNVGDVTDSKPKGILKSTTPGHEEDVVMAHQTEKDFAPAVQPLNRSVGQFQSEQQISFEENARQPEYSTEEPIQHHKNPPADEQTSLDVSISQLGTSEFTTAEIRDKDLSELYEENISKSEQEEDNEYDDDYEEDITEDISEEMEENADNKGREQFDDVDVHPSTVEGRGIAPPPPQAEDDVGDSTDSETICVSRRSINFEDSSPKSTVTSEKSGENQNSVVIEVAYVELKDKSSIIKNPDINYLMVDYSFLGINYETPEGLPKPKKSDKDKKIKYNFQMTFPVDYANHLDNRRFLASSLLPTDPDSGNVIFNLVHEPENEDDECNDVGIAKVSLREIYKKKKNVLNECFPVYSTSDPKEEIGEICVTIKCLAALTAITEELEDSPLAL